ncbi:hypothetical protein ACFQI7_08265 [Paenibacillus allorhizosphaerae]|uniref:hypothetical protein n=1 Tax=Paenibacillus allorhizosphaerae TaxID=2849866 RepID=UPI001C401CBF|nr:hypothetical protein [Paenibacillus allorhizosphaerae]
MLPSLAAHSLLRALTFTPSLTILRFVITDRRQEIASSRLLIKYLFPTSVPYYKLVIIIRAYD